MEFNLDDALNGYEAGLLTFKAEIELMSFLIKSGQIDNLPRHYGDRAYGYIGIGVLNFDGMILWKLKDN